MEAKRRSAVYWTCLAASLCLSGCVGNVTEPGLGGPGGGGPGGGGPNGRPNVVCEDDKIVARPDELLRLTAGQYRNALADLVGVDLADLSGFSDGRSGTFESNGTSDQVSGSVVKGYLDAAEAAAMAMDVTTLGCSAGRACVEDVVRSLGRRAYRQPISDQDAAPLLAVYDDGVADGWTHDEALRGVVMAMLMSPRLVYRWNETMDDPSEEPTPLDAIGLASRMAFFLWESVPDDELLDAAIAGDLDTPEGIEAQARRMVASDQVRRSIRSFHRQWMHIDNANADDKRDPSFTATLAASMEESSYLFAEEAALEGGGLRELLTGSHAFVDEDLAPVFGVSVPADGEFHRVDLDPSERAGILTQPRVLAALARYDDVSWVSRGQFVRERLLCEHITPPPPDVDMTVLNNPDRTTPGSACAGCHQVMDPIGRGLDEYDPIGRMRTTYDDGTTIDEVIDVRGAAGFSDLGQFEDAPELARALSELPQVHRCYAEQWYEMALGPVRDEDTCAIDDITERFDASDLDILELMVAIVTSEPFRYRIPPQEVSP